VIDSLDEIKLHAISN